MLDSPSSLFSRSLSLSPGQTFGSSVFQTCLRNTKVQVPLLFTPSFDYSYLCTSHILTSYVPVYIQSALISTFTAPLVDVALLLLYKSWPAKLPCGLGSIKATLRGMVPPFFLSRAEREANLEAKRAAEAASATAAELDDRDRKLTLPLVGLRVPFALLCKSTRAEAEEKKRLQDEKDERDHKLRLPLLSCIRIHKFWASRRPPLSEEQKAAKAAEEEQKKVQDAIENRKPKFVNADAFLTSSTNSIIVGLTFGMVAPLLAVVQIASICFSSLYLEFKIVQFVRREVSSPEDEGDGEVAPHTTIGVIPPKTLACLQTLVKLRLQLVKLGAALLSVLVPVVVLASQFNVYASPAGWVTTFSFVHGAAPAAIMLVVWNAVLLWFRFVFFSSNHAASGEESSEHAVAARQSSAAPALGKKARGLGEVKLASGAVLFATPPSSRRPRGGNGAGSEDEVICRLPPGYVLAFDQSEEEAGEGEGEAGRLAVRVLIEKKVVAALVRKERKSSAAAALESLPVDSSGLVHAWTSLPAAAATATVATAAATSPIISREFAAFGGDADFFSVAELERDAAGINPHGVEDIEWAIHLFSGIFCGVFLWDSFGVDSGWKAGAQVAIIMIVLPSALSLVQPYLLRRAAVQKVLPQ